MKITIKLPQEEITSAFVEGVTTALGDGVHAPYEVIAAAIEKAISRSIPKRFWDGLSDEIADRVATKMAAGSRI